MGTGSNLMNWVVTYQWHGSTDLWNFLENGKYNGKGTLNTITVILPNNFELPLVLSLWFADASNQRSFDSQDSPSGLCLTGYSYLVLILNFCIDRPFGFSIYRDNHFFFMSLIFSWTALSGFQSTETLILPKSPFQVCDLSSCYFLTEYFLTAPAFIGRVSLSPSTVVKVIAHEPS